MRKCLVMLAVLFFAVSLSYADNLSLGEVLQKVPPLKQGIMYEVADCKIEYLSTLEVASWKNITLEAGYTQENTIIGVISYPILKLKDLGVNLPILDLVELNIGYGVGVDELFTRECELKHGPTLTLINVKF